jgi:hypothetical protein
MRARFVLVGTKHQIQFGVASEEEIKSFQTRLSEVCLTHGIKYIAEEASKDALCRFSVSETLGALLAKKLGIRHEMVDLSRVERSEFGIEDGQLSGATCQLAGGFDIAVREALNEVSDQVREGVWIGRMLRASTWPALLIIGADHVQRVKELIGKFEKSVLVAIDDFA